VVFVHEYPGPSEGPYCGFWPYAVKLSHGGIRSLLFNLRCFGESACPQGARHARPVSDVSGAVEEIQRLGARRVVLVGASLGGAVVIQAGAAIRPLVAGVVDLSGELNLGNLLGSHSHLDAGAAAPRVIRPTLLAVARGDRYTPISDMKILYKRLGTSDKRLIVEPFTYGHGWLMLSGPNLSWSRLARQVEDFIHRAGG
jgi:dienelactone hydrolase